MSQYSTGLSSVTNGSPTVTGSNTLWLANVSAGDSFTIASTGVMYDVASVDSDTQITLSVAYAGVTAAGAVYAIGTGFTVPDSFPEMSQGDIETATIFTRAMRTIQSKFSEVVSDISDKAAIAGQTFTGDIAAPKITASTGVLFGTDTAAANTLDDYEQGNWTPVVSGGTKVISSLGRAHYVKVGSLVYIQLRVSSFTGGDGTKLEFSGLPFATATDSFSVGSISYGSGTLFTNAVVRTPSSQSILQFRRGFNAKILQTEIDGFLIASIVYDVG